MSARYSVARSHTATYFSTVCTTFQKFIIHYEAPASSLWKVNIADDRDGGVTSSGSWRTNLECSAFDRKNATRYVHSHETAQLLTTRRQRSLMLDAGFRFDSRATSVTALGCCGREGITDARTDLRLRPTYATLGTIRPPHLTRCTSLLARHSLLYLRFSEKLHAAANEIETRRRDTVWLSRLKA